MASASEILKAYLHCARTPAEDAVERIRTQLKKQYGAAEVELTVSVEPDLISGYVLQVGGRVFDNSGKSALAAITADAPSLAVMQTRVEDYKPAATTAEGGTVISAADGVVDVKGMDQAVYGEIVTFDTGAKGMVESVEPDHLGVMLFDDIEKVGVGTLVTRSGKRAGIPVGDAFLPASAQCEAKNDAFQSGEHVMYDLYFNWKFVWVKAGLASLTTNATTYHSQPAYRINLLALGSKRADFFFKMRDTLTCVIGEKLEPRYFRKGAEEGKRYTVDEAWFSYKDGLCLVNQKRTYRDGAFDESEASDSRCIYDMLSILAQARSYDPADYKVGDKIKFPMATGRKVEEQTLIYRGKENVKAENGVTYRCLIFSLVEYDKKGKEKEVITFFVTDDLNHLPVRLDLFLNFGSAKAFLNNVTGNRHPLTSIVK